LRLNEAVRLSGPKSRSLRLIPRKLVFELGAEVPSGGDTRGYVIPIALRPSEATFRTPVLIPGVDVGKNPCRQHSPCDQEDNGGDCPPDEGVASPFRP
jgi:hypothetical protein